MDQGINHPTEGDFYLLSHEGIQVRDHPPVYALFYNINNFLYLIFTYSGYESPLPLPGALGRQRLHGGRVGGALVLPLPPLLQVV